MVGSDSDLFFAEGEVLPPIPPEPSLLDKVDDLVSAIASREVQLAGNYVRLGSFLLTVQQTGEWRKVSVSFNSYLGIVQEKLQRGRSQIYAYIGISETLLPYLPENVLEDIGVGRAMELRRFVVQSGRRLPQSLVDIATDRSKGAAELKAAVFQELHQTPDVKGKWFDFGGCFATKDERLEIERAWRLAARVDPVVSTETPEPQRRLEIMLRLCREFASTYDDGGE